VFAVTPSPGVKPLQNKIKSKIPKNSSSVLIFKKKKKAANTVVRKGRILESWSPPPQSPGNPVHQIPHVTWYLLSSVTL
jgi:hypothetical protein